MSRLSPKLRSFVPKPHRNSRYSSKISNLLHFLHDINYKNSYNYRYNGKNMNIAKIIKFHRKQSGLSQAELAKLAGLGKTVIFDIENGKLSIRLNTLLKILHVLNIKINLTSSLMKTFEEVNNEES